MFSWLAMLVLVLAACAPAQEATPTPARPAPTATPTLAAVPTPTPLSGVIPRPTSTPLPSPTPTGAAAAQIRRGGILRTAQPGDPPGWDFMKLPGGGSLFRMHSNLVFSQLATVPNAPETGCSWETRLELAESWKWANDITLEVKIRAGVRFHNKPPVNGRELTADDVAYTMKRFLKVQARGAEIAPRIKEIQVKDKYTLVISLTEPVPDLPHHTLLANYYGHNVLAREAGGPEESWEDPAKSYIGTGPFLFGEYVVGVKVTYARNPNYWKPGLPYVDGIDWRIIPERSTQTALLRSGRLDLVTYGMGISVVEELGKTAPEIKIYPCAGFSGTVTFMRVDKPPLNDVRVRRAISMAIDREAVQASVLKGQGEVIAYAPTILPVYLAPKDFPPEIRQYVEYHPDRAKALLAEAGYPGGKGLELTYNHTRGRHALYWEQWTEVAIAALESLGIKVNARWLEYPVYSRMVLAGDYSDMATTGIVPAEVYLSLATFWSQSSPARNRGHVKDPAMDSMIEEFNRTVDTKRQRELARDMQFRIIDQAWMLFPPYAYEFSIYQPWVRNFGPIPFSVFSGSWAERVWQER